MLKNSQFNNITFTFTFVLILHLWVSPAAADWSEDEPASYDEKNVGVNKKHVYADLAELTVLRES